MHFGVFLNPYTRNFAPLIETVLNWRKECARRRLPTGSRTFVFRANPISKVTDLFCRFPLPTLFYWLESVKLRNLLRISVRSRVKIILSLWFSRNNWNRSDRNSGLGFVFLLLQAVWKAILLKVNLDSRRSLRDWCRSSERANDPFKKKRKLFLIFQLSISKYKFNVTIKDIYRRPKRASLLG